MFSTMPGSEQATKCQLQMIPVALVMRGSRLKIRGMTIQFPALFEIDALFCYLCPNDQVQGSLWLVVKFS